MHRARLLLTLFFLPLFVSLHAFQHPLHKIPPRLQSTRHLYGFPRTVHLHAGPFDQALHPSVPHFTRLHSVELYGGMAVVGEYYAKIHIGGQMLRAQIDTGSATLAVPLGECNGCRAGDRRYHMERSNTSIASRIRCDDSRCMKGGCLLSRCGGCSAVNACCSKESPRDCGFHLSFGDGAGASGCLVQDEMSWGGVSFPVVFGGILRDSPDFERNQVDGILGMAYPSLACNPSCITPPLEAMAAHLKIKNMFQLCISEQSGLLVLGDEDKSLAVEETKWVPLRLGYPPSYYTVRITGNLRVGGEEIVLPAFRRAIVDSGTTLIVLTTRSFVKLKTYLRSKYCHVHGLCDRKSWFRPAHCVRLPLEELRSLPDLVIPLENGMEIELGPDEYMINYASKGKDYWCVGIMSLRSMSGGIDVILGNTVMKKYVTTFDRARNLVGFAKSRGDCVSRPRVLSEDSEGRKLSAGKEAPPKRGVGESDLPIAGQGKGSPTAHRRDGVCSLASTCGECAKVQGCAWSGEDGVCIRGRAVLFMCLRQGIFGVGRVFFVVGGAVSAGIILAAVFLAVVRRGRSREGDEEEAQEGLHLLDQDENNATTEVERNGDSTINGNGHP